MLDTKWSGISQKQLQNLKISFEQNKESYLSDIQAQKKEIKSVMTLISILPVLGLIFFVIDIISNNKSILEVLSDNFLFTLAILLGYIGVFMLISWGLINSKKTKYNKKSLFEIFNDFVSLSLNSEKTNYNNNDFYELAYKGGILNGIPNDIKISSYNSGELEYESDNIFTQEHSGKGMRTVDNCYLGKITFPKKITDISLLAKENSTNTLKGISKRIVNSLYSALVLVGLYYILIVEKCERKIIGDGCKNEIDLLGFLHPTYFSYVAIIAVIIFTFGYVKTLYKKGNIKNSTLDDKLDIFSGTNISELGDREQEIFKIIKRTLDTHIHIGKNGSFYINQNYIYLRFNKRAGIYKTNFVKGLLFSIRSGMSKNTTEQSLTRENVNYLNFNIMLENLGKEILHNS